MDTRHEEVPTETQEFLDDLVEGVIKGDYSIEEAVYAAFAEGYDLGILDDSLEIAYADGNA